MTGALAAGLAALAAGLLAGGGHQVLRARLWRQPVAGRPSTRSSPVPQLLARFRPKSRASQQESDIAEACLALGAELQAGAPVVRALAVVAADWPDLFGPVATRAAIGGDAAAALRAVAAQPGAASLRAVAAGWQVTDQTGAPLSRIVTAVADSLRADAAIRREVQSQLATARATARLLAVLPFGTLVLLSGGDGAAIGFLTGTPIGVVCLGAALLFVGAGLWWVGRLAKSATRSVWEA